MSEQPKIVREQLEDICLKRFQTKSFWNTFMKEHNLTFDQTVLYFMEFEKRFTTYEEFNESLHYEPFVYYHKELKTLGKSMTTEDGVVFIRYIKDGKLYDEYENLGDWEKRKNHEESND